jgi:ABC-type antimicrobial peptide transport system permease subunit
MFFLHHQSATPKVRYGSLLYASLVAIFAIVAFYYPVVGLTGVGSLLFFAGVFVEMNADSVWRESQKWHKKNRKHVPWWNRPTAFFYTTNVYILWPLIILMGIVCLVVAYYLAGVLH